MKAFLYMSAIGIICCAFTSDLQKKVIRSGDGFDIECYVSPIQLKKYNANKMYYWFRSGEVHQSVSNAGGYVLHKSYSKYYKSNQLAEQGQFNYGLKEGEWKTWYKNGMPKEIVRWADGYKQGSFVAYDSLGAIIIKGTYNNNLKSGYWIDYLKRDTSYHRKNEIFKKRPLTLAERVLRKKDSIEKAKLKNEKRLKKQKDSLNRIKQKQERLFKKRNDSIKKVKAKQEKANQKRLDSISKNKSPKKGFFDRLFNKD